jgi:quinol monooxygenase YgiN
MEVHVVAHIESRAGHHDTVQKALQAVVEPTRKEQGCLQYDLFHDSDNINRFTFVEKWASAEFLLRHSQSEHMATAGAALKDLAAQPIWIQKLKVIDEMK